MAITFKIANGDYVINNSTGRFKTIGNVINGDDPKEANLKNRQDLRRSLSLSKVANGTTANIAKLIGIVPESGVKAVALLINRQIRNMFAAIIRQQRLRPNVRPNREKFSAITILKVFLKTGEKTTFRFRFGTRTINKDNVDITGSVG